MSKAELSSLAGELMDFYDNLNCLGVAELVRYLDGPGKSIQKMGTCQYGIHVFLNKASSEEERKKLLMYYVKKIYLGNLNGTERPIDTLNKIKEAFATLPSESRVAFDEFCLEATARLSGKISSREMKMVSFIAM